MSLTCDRYYTLKINLLTARLRGYWTMTGVGGVLVPAVDEVAGANATIIQIAAGHTGVNYTAFGKIASCGYLAAGVNNTSGFDTGQVASLATTGGGFSLFGWILAGLFAPAVIPPRIEIRFAGPMYSGGFGWIGMDVGSLTPNAAWDYRDGSGATGNGAFTISAPGPPFLWDFFHMFFDQTNGRVGLSINNAAPNYLGAGLSFPTSSTGRYSVLQTYAGAGAINLQVDEVGFADGPVTAAQITSIYNASAGVTWPAVSVIIPP